MSAGSGIRAGQAYVEMGLNDKSLSAGLRAAQEKVKAFGASMQAIGKGLLGAGAAMAAPLGLSVNTFASFEKTMARVKGLTQANEAEFAALSREAKRLGEETEYSATEAAQMMAEFAQRGFKVNQILTASAPALAMATSGNLQLAEAAGIASDIMNGMQLNASKLGDVTDIMAVAFSTSATDLRQLGEAFKYVGPDALAAGISLEEITSAIMILSDAGIKADMAGTTLRGGLQSLINPSNEAKAALARLGVSIKTEDGRFRKFADIVEDMTTGLEKLSEVEAAQAIGEIFTNRQATGFSVLTRRNKETGESGADLLRQKTDSLGPDKRQGAAFRVQKDLLATLWGAWKLIESAIEGVSITIGEALAPTVQEWGAAMLHGIGLLHQIVKDNKEWIPTIAKTALVLGGIGAALFAVGSAVTLATFAFGGLATAAGAVAGLIGAAFSPVIIGVVAAVGLVIAAVSEMGVTWESMIPVLKAFGGVALAAVGVAVGAVMVWVAIVKQAVKAIALAFNEIGKGLSETFPAMMRSIGEGFGSLVKRFAGFFDDITATFNQAWGGIVDAVKAGNLALAGEIGMAGLKVVWQQGIIFLTKLWRDFAGYFVFLWYDSVTAVALIFNSVWSGLERAWFESFSLISTAWGYTVDFMAKTFSKAIGKMAVGWAGFEAIMKGGGPAAVGAAMGKATAEIDKQVEDIIKKIDEERVASNKQIEKDRQAIEDKRNKTENEILDANQKQKDAYKRGTEDLVAQSAKELAAAQKELADAVKKAADELKMKGLATPLAAGFAEAIKAAKLSGADPKAAFAQAERVAGTGIGAGETAGTFDAAMLRYLGNTSGDSVAKQQLREQQEQNRLMERLIEIARAAGKTFGS